MDCKSEAASHYAGCDCNEAHWQDQVARLTRERDEAIAGWQRSVRTSERAESRAERLEAALREIESKTGHFGEAPPPPEWMPMLSLIAWVGRISRAALGEEGK